MKSLVKRTVQQLGGHLFSQDSLPTGVNWLVDIKRGRALGPQPVCLDVGANVGQTVAALQATFADASIHAFEPFSGPRAVLMQATTADARVVVVPLAMGSAPGRMQVQPHAHSDMSSLAHPAELQSGLPPETIDIDTLDAYCARQSIARVDVLKTDTEGYDLEVLRGASGLLARQKVAYVYVEVTFLPGNHQNTPFSPVFDLLSGYGYRFLGLYETYPLHCYDEPLVFCNALFVSASARQHSLAMRRAA